VTLLPFFLIDGVSGILMEIEVDMMVSETTLWFPCDGGQ
jgi:hypothetical protein